MHVLDAAGDPVPPGVIGELCIGGAGVARGYHGRPDLTAERFVQHAGERVYRTGDRVRQRAGGTLEFLGRTDDQLKLRGFRIEPAEIEAILRALPGVRDVAVALRPGSGGEGQLVAYLTGPVPPDNALRAAVRERLPVWMMPSAFVRLAELPHTPNGKTDRRALPAPSNSIRGEGAALRTAAERTLAAIWRNVLGVEEVGTTDDFFELGGHSLLAVRLLDRIEEAYGRRIPLATLLSAPTIEGLQHALLYPDGGDTGSLIVPVQGGGTRLPFFYLHGQLVGGGFYTLKLAREMGPDQPFYAVQPHRLAGRELPPAIEEIAASYVEAIRAIQPAGPYLLGGFCLQGIVALEMVRQLEVQGETVDLLALVHTQRPSLARTVWVRRALVRLAALLGREPTAAMDWYTDLQDLREYGRAWRRHPRQQKLMEAVAVASASWRWLTAKDGKRQFTLPASLTVNGQGRRLAPYVWAAAAYAPRPISQRVVLFRSEDDPGDLFLGKQPLAEDIEVHLVPRHDSVIGEDVDELAHCLAAVVARANHQPGICPHTVAEAGR